MDNSIDRDTPLFKLTLGELIDVMEFSKPQVEPRREEKKWLVYGIEGIAELFHCKKATANNIKRSGKIDKAISQVGKIIVVDAELALSLTRKKK